MNFSAEEIGLYGAAAYAAQHAGALSQTELGIYFDGQSDFLGRNNVHVLGQEGLAHMVEQRCAAVAYPVDVHHHFTGLDQVFLSAHDVPLLISRATSTKIQDVFRLDCPMIRRKRLPSM